MVRRLRCFFGGPIRQILRVSRISEILKNFIKNSEDSQEEWKEWIRVMNKLLFDEALDDNYLIPFEICRHAKGEREKRTREEISEDELQLN